ncbi:MAG: DUF86 domain-containing protein [Desulfatiglans sp.]|jgi:uncharacterized protein with HEPN domain|nr:DUF86 domain-containing protein [Desulfatiglans sp.]
MFDIGMVKEILKQIFDATQKIQRRFALVHSVNDFTGSETGMEKLDSICMLLIAIGESIKNLDKKTNNELLSRYPNTEWKKIMGLRDIISHHYFDVDAEVIYDVCINHIKPLSSTIQKMIDEL